MAALKYITSAVLRRGASKSLLHRHIDNNVDISEQFKWYTYLVGSADLARQGLLRGAGSGEG